MENCTNKYLHKKFKKQISEIRNQDSDNNVNTTQNSEKVTISVEDKCNSELTNCTDNKYVVPKQSTNNYKSPLFCNANSSEKSSISNVIKVNVITKNDDSIYHHHHLQQQQLQHQKQEHQQTYKSIDVQSSGDIVNPQSINSCISYNIFSRVEGQIPIENSNRDANFDTNFKIIEPKQLKKSSITQNAQENIILPFSLNSIEKLDDISLNTSTIKETSNYDNKICNKSNEKNENQTIEKSAGGKYICTYCNLACSKPSVLQKHIRAHTNERPYPCISCGSRFKTRSNLYKHCRSRTHANRVMGNKTLENNNDGDVDNQTRYEFYNRNDISESKNTSDNNEIQENLNLDQNNYNTNDVKPKPYKPRFHTTKQFNDILTKENIIEDPKNYSINTNISSHINEIIHKNHYIINSSDGFCSGQRYDSYTMADQRNNEEPLNLSNKNRKRCLSEVAEPSAQKSLIKELLLKNLYAGTDMQCPHCKMIFQTVTELELHKLRSCKGFTKSGARYSRSSSVNVASILTQNKNAFDGIPQLQESFFQLKSPGPFLGKTRLIDSDKNKSFSFEDGIQTTRNDMLPVTDFLRNSYRNLSMPGENIKRPPVKLFGGEVKITHTSGETKSFKVDSKESDSFLTNSVDYNSKLSENTVVKSILQSGGTVLQNKTTYKNHESLSPVDVMKVYQNRSVSPNAEVRNSDKSSYQLENKQYASRDISPKANNLKVPNEIFRNSKSISVSTEYTNIMDFSQKAVKSFAPNLKQLNLAIPGVPIPNMIPKSSPMASIGPLIVDENIQEAKILNEKFIDISSSKDMHLHNPMTLLVNGKMVRYVPGIPGPITAEVHLDSTYRNNEINHLPTIVPQVEFQKPIFKITPAEQTVPIPTAEKTTDLDEIHIKHTNSNVDILPETSAPRSSPKNGNKLSNIKSSSSCNPSSTITDTPKKFVRPNSLALKPTLASMKQHHGLTPTVFNQILISPDTPRVAKKYIEHLHNGYYFSYLGLKSSTKSVYCTLNKTQPFYVPHFKKLSMYSEWRQQDTKADKLYVSAYDSRQKQQKYVSGQISKPVVVHSSYKFSTPKQNSYKEDSCKTNPVAGGYESTENYTYIRGRGRGRYVCDQCGIRCKKPSMLKKHIRTHTNDRPYTCNHCNFSFKTKGNLTKHMKCKSHTKNYYASSSSSTFNQPNSAPTSESDTDDSGMDSSDESSRQHEAAYGLLSLSQKTSTIDFHASSNENNIFCNTPTTTCVVSKETISIMDDDEIVHVSKTSFAKNKILTHPEGLCFSKTLNKITSNPENQTDDMKDVNLYLGKTIININRPLTYPYTSPLTSSNSTVDKPKNMDVVNDNSEYSNSSDVERMIADPSKENSVRINYNFNSSDEFGVVGNDTNKVCREPSPVNEVRKRKFKLSNDVVYDPKVAKQDTVMDLSVNSSSNKENGDVDIIKVGLQQPARCDENSEIINFHKHNNPLGTNTQYTSDSLQNPNLDNVKFDIKKQNDYYPNVEKSYEPKQYLQNGETNYISEDSSSESRKVFYIKEYDNSAMETLADIATKQMKLEKNSIAKNVATEFLKLATKNDSKNLDNLSESSNFITSNKDVNDLISKREENKSCTICAKNFSKPSQLRLHMNIHYLERPFRCDSCSVSFRTKGHLQKHERSASHHNKLSSSPALSSSEPRPFKCSDCNIAFRIHGHLAKHLRSKMHIMKLECLAKIPFGLYAELERSNSLLTEINTSDGEQCLESLKNLAKKVFINDPNKLNPTKGSSSVVINVIINNNSNS